MDKARKADKKVRNVAGRQVRNVGKKLGARIDIYKDELYKRAFSRKKKDRNKVYPLNKVNVQCIRKGKEHELWEFDNKVSITRTVTGVIVGAQNFRNEFDGYTLDGVLSK